MSKKFGNAVRPKQNETRKETCVMRIKEVDDVEHESSEEQWEAGGRGRARRKEDYARTQSTTVKRTGKNRTRDDASSALQLVQTLHQGKGVRGGLSENYRERQAPEIHIGLHVHG